MPAQWRFYRQAPTDPIQNPIAGEFFSTEAVGNVTEALVREAIQNSLDARIRTPDGKRQAATVRIFLSGVVDALPAVRARRWFGSLWPHVMARGNGLAYQPEAHASCPFLVCEDFGTIGLRGDPAEYRLSDGVENHFLNFFRAEGHSDKGGHEVGSWGVGKTVFPRTSRIASFLGFTVRSDDHRRLLLGRSILKYHAVADQTYKSNGYFGLERADGLMMPSEDPVLLDELRHDFQVRREDESGLSVVVPWYDVDGDDSIDRDTVTAAVLRGFFYPILMSHLSVTIATPGNEATFDANSIVTSVQALPGTLKEELLPLIELAEWARTRMPTEFSALLPPRADHKQNWSPQLVPSELVRVIRQSLAQRQRVAIRVPLSVQPRNANPQSTFFDIFVEHSAEDSRRPVFVRDELIIPDVRPPRASQLRSLVIVEDGPLATLLRDAETPAHTQWSPDTSKFKNKYKFGVGVINFVRFSVSELTRIINQADEEADPTITIDFFSIPSPAEEDEPRPFPRPGPQPKDGPTPPPPPPPPPALRRFRIERLRGGFAIRSGDPEAARPPYIDIRVAYDVRRGNPLKRYHSADFDLGRPPIHWDADQGGLAVESAEGNRMRIAVTDATFRLEVTGFDPDRDLYVKAEARETANGD